MGQWHTKRSEAPTAEQQGVLCEPTATDATHTNDETPAAVPQSQPVVLEEDPRVSELRRVTPTLPVDVCERIVYLSTYMYWVPVIRMHGELMKLRGQVSDAQHSMMGDHSLCHSLQDKAHTLCAQILSALFPSIPQLLSNASRIFATALDEVGSLDEENGHNQSYEFTIPENMNKVLVTKYGADFTLEQKRSSGSNKRIAAIDTSPFGCDVTPGQYTLVRSASEKKSDPFLDYEYGYSRNYQVVVLCYDKRLGGVITRLNTIHPTILQSFQKVKQELDSMETEKICSQGLGVLLDLPPKLVAFIWEKRQESCEALSQLLSTADPSACHCPSALRTLLEKNNGLVFGYSFHDPAWSRGTDWGMTLTLRPSGTCRIDYSSVSDRRNDDLFIRCSSEGVWTCRKSRITLTTMQTVVATRCGPLTLSGGSSELTTQELDISGSGPVKLIPKKSGDATPRSGRYSCVSEPLTMDESGCGLSPHWAQGWGEFVNDTEASKTYIIPDSDPAKILQEVSSLDFFGPPCRNTYY